MELEKHITDEKTGISYTLCGGSCYKRVYL